MLEETRERIGENFNKPDKKDDIMYQAERDIQRLKEASWMSDEAYTKLEGNLRAERY